MPQKITARKPVIELYGPHLYNKGDHLMAHAIVQHFSDDFVLAMLPSRTHYTPERSVVSPHQLRSTKGTSEDLLNVLHDNDTVNEKDIAVVCDCSGYTYGSVWNEGYIHTMAERYLQWKAQGKIIIMFPQSFGPFLSKSAQADMKTILSCADIVFAREITSRDFLLELCTARERIHIAPDFTNTLSGEPPADFCKGESVGIVPNMRMMDKTESSIRNSYPRFMERCIETVKEGGLHPVLIAHEEYDEEWIRILARKTGTPVFIHPDPLVLKGALGSCVGVIASRYHALVSSLSQAVPTIGTSWSHKYADLFDLYDCPRNLIATTGSDTDLRSSLDIILDAEKRAKQSEYMRIKSSQHSLLTEKFWQDVEEVIRTGDRTCAPAHMH